MQDEGSGCRVPTCLPTMVNQQPSDTVDQQSSARQSAHLGHSVAERLHSGFHQVVGQRPQLQAGWSPSVENVVGRKPLGKSPTQLLNPTAQQGAGPAAGAQGHRRPDGGLTVGFLLISFTSAPHSNSPMYTGSRLCCSSFRRSSTMWPYFSVARTLQAQAAAAGGRCCAAEEQGLQASWGANQAHGLHVGPGGAPGA